MPRRPPTLAFEALALALLALAFAAGAGCRRAPAPPDSIYAKPTPGETAELLAQAKAGQRNAQRELGLRYYAGDGLPQDPRLAARWWRAAAEAGDDQAASALALLQYTGDGVQQDQVQAARWWQRAANSGNADAQATVGWLISTASGCAATACSATPGPNWPRPAAWSARA